MSKKARQAPQNELLIERFAKCGVKVSDAVPAFVGLYPTFNGFGNWELLFTRWRILALAAGEVQVWSAWSGPTPRKLLASDDHRCLVVQSGHRRYCKVILDGRRIWVHRRDLPSVKRWLDAAQ